MSKKSKVSLKLKLQACKDVIEGKCSYREVARTLKISPMTIQRWVCNYRSEGIKGLIARTHFKAYSPEVKLSAVQDYLSGSIPVIEICEKYQIRKNDQLLNWVKKYNSHEKFQLRTGGSSIMTKSRKTTQEERLEIVQYCTAHDNNYGQTALAYKVSYQQVFIWMKKYRQMGKSGLEDRRGHRTGTLPSRTPEEELRDCVAQLERKNHWLQMEIDALKKLDELERRDALALHARKENTKQ
ncbi:helix-turn-helix domain-containing protein [Anaerosinus massiliensis]|uniref:helix-turn-helix domain-containing protein n=2 Tax=Massilibacillus massiliensis TaxID=1806837 RepID=UPI000AA675D1|nr:helix-turn-helix domain-containing protein [Massilibacillus massiliensis]